MNSNFHTHCKYCDGKGDPEDYVKKAIELGFVSLGFSSHAPIIYENPWTMKSEVADTYLNEVRSLKEKYSEKIQIYLGMETDFIIYGNKNWSWDYKKYSLDYTIGSVHFLYDNEREIHVCVDGNAEEFKQGLETSFDGDIVRFAKNYYGNIREMIPFQKPTIIGHLDIMKKNNRDNRYFSEEDTWYRDEVLKTLQSIADFGAIMEVNTGGMSRGYIDTVYPSPWILEEARKLDIPVMLNSDTHVPDNMDAYFEKARSIMKESGYKKHMVLLNNKWTGIDL